MRGSAYAFVVALVGLQRLRELAISRRHESRYSGSRAAARSYPVMVAANVALFTLPLVEVAVRRPRPRAAGLWLALLAGATGLRWWSIASLGPSWNVRAVVPDDLVPVTAGPYRYVRHPNYLAVAAEFLALPMLGGAWMSALALSIVDGLVLADRIRAEERLLAGRPGYSEAFSGRSRFFPGVF